ncbi:hypothetical protein FO617_07920 [Enterobacter hormaechei subsp. steigerwaltii]|nr:hypothetical protein FO617_07920 [Enterobacter hormaechei subsp. steigerwaltii]RTO43406.1 hypothetical protein EKN62_18235 [Enterobacter hormaechei]
MSHSLMTDVISAKNRKRRGRRKVVLPIFTQPLRNYAGFLFWQSLCTQNEVRFVGRIQINLL